MGRKKLAYAVTTADERRFKVYAYTGVDAAVLVCRRLGIDIFNSVLGINTMKVEFLKEDEKHGYNGEFK